MAHRTRTVSSAVVVTFFLPVIQKRQAEVAQMHKQTTIVQQEQERSLDRLVELIVFTACITLIKTAFSYWLIRGIC
jgi:hypothetical protein